jgi:hypothetical protein
MRMKETKVRKGAACSESRTKVLNEVITVSRYVTSAMLLVGGHERITYQLENMKLASKAKLYKRTISQC